MCVYFCVFVCTFVCICVCVCLCVCVCAVVEDLLGVLNVLAMLNCVHYFHFASLFVCSRKRLYYMCL